MLTIKNKKLLFIILQVILMGCTNNSNTNKKSNDTNISKSDLNNKESMIDEKDQFLFQGVWKSKEDSSYVMNVIGDSIAIYSGGDKLGKFKFGLLTKCNGVENKIEDPLYLGFFDEETQRIECESEILGLTKTNLTLMNIEYGSISYFEKM